MCNLYTQTRSVDEVAQLFREMQMPLSFPEGIPNLEPRDIRITEMAPIVRAPSPGRYELVMRRWSWPGNGGKPVYNFRSDGREFSSGRCLVIADGFYEFTTPTDPKQKLKDRWLFRWAEDEGIVGIAGLTRDAPGLGEAFTMLTTEPGEDVAPYHGRQVALVPPTDWRGWLDYSRPASELLKVLPGGSLSVCSAMGDA
jgi:putative SOS response-associated peptidase YedK